MSILIKGKDFGPTEQVTSVKLDQLVDNATFTNFSEAAVAYTGTTGTCLQGGGLEVTSGGQLQIADSGVGTNEIANDAVNQDKIAADAVRSEHIADNAINDANMITGAVINTGNIVAGAVDTNQLADDAVDQSKTSFIDSGGAMVLTGSNPQVTFDDTGNSGTSPRVSGNSEFGNLNILAEKSGADIVIDADDLVILRNNGSNILSTSDTVAKDASGANASGAQVTGCLEVTQDLYVGGSVSDINIKGPTPMISFEDTDVSVASPNIQSFDTGNIEVQSNQSGSVVRLDGKGGVILQENASTILTLNSTAGKNENGGDVSGVQVTGGLYVTGDVYADDHVVADHLRLQGDGPNIVFSDSNVGTPNAYITGNGVDANSQKLLMYAPKGGGDIAMHSSDNFAVKVTNNGTADYNSNTNPYHERFIVAHDAGRNASGTDTPGAKVSGDFRVTGDIHCSGDYNNINIVGSDPRLELSRSGVTTAPAIKGYATGSIEILTQQSESDIILDAKDNVNLQYDNNTVFRAGDQQGKNASNTLVAGCRVEGSLQVDDDANVGGTIRTAALKIGTDNILDLIHPVGSVIQTTTNYANSAAVVAKYGGTTWTRFSEGRMLAGYKSTDSDFSAGNEDGSKTVTLTKAQLPENITHTNTKISFGGNGVPSFSVSGDFSFGGSPATNHQPKFGEGGTNPSRIVNLDIGGDGDAHDNMPPYKVVYMWTRTA